MEGEGYYDSLECKWTTITTTAPSPETIRREQERSLDHIPINVIECYLRKKKLERINETED